MADEPVRVVFHLDQDWNLVGVFCCAVEHQAIQAGFETEAGAQLARAAGDVCRETISQLGRQWPKALTSRWTRFPTASKLRSIAAARCCPPSGWIRLRFPMQNTGGAGGLNGRELLSRVDRVLYNAEDGVARTTLVKFLPAHH